MRSAFNAGMGVNGTFLGGKDILPAKFCGGVRVFPDEGIRQIDLTISLCLSLFPWTMFRRTKGAVKLHLLLDHDDYLPTSAYISNGSLHDATIDRNVPLAPGSMVAMDRGYNDYKLFALDRTWHILTTNYKKKNPRTKQKQSYWTRQRPVKKWVGFSSKYQYRCKAHPQAWSANGTPIRVKQEGYKNIYYGSEFNLITITFKISQISFS